MKKKEIYILKNKNIINAKTISENFVKMVEILFKINKTIITNLQIVLKSNCKKNDQPRYIFNSICPFHCQKTTLPEHRTKHH